MTNAQMVVLTQRLDNVDKALAALKTDIATLQTILAKMQSNLVDTKQLADLLNQYKLELDAVKDEVIV